MGSKKLTMPLLIALLIFVVIFSARTVTRGVNKVVKEDLKLAMERQVLRSNENVNSLIRNFLTDEADLLKLNLST